MVAGHQSLRGCTWIKELGSTQMSQLISTHSSKITQPGRGDDGTLTLHLGSFTFPPPGCSLQSRR